MSRLKLWYPKPALTWDEVLPLGNGHLGAMVWGTALREQIGLNEGTLWSGYKRDKNNPDALKTLPKVRELIFREAYASAQSLLEKEMLGEFTESYLPLGSLLIESAEQGEVLDYVRELNLNDACARVSYAQNSKRFSRECFVSYPHKALILRLDAEERALNVTFRFTSELRYTIQAEEQSLRIFCQCPDHADPNYTETATPILWGDKGKRFEARLAVLSTDGTVSIHGDALRIQHAGSAVLSFTAVNNPDVTAAYQNMGYDGLLESHVTDYKALFDRVELDLGSQPDLPTDERLMRLKAGGEDPGLFALYFQYGRYLMISASRKGGQAMNLQGLWCWEMQPPWSSNYTTNINTQMNYWPALSCNLAECMEPYFGLLQKVSEEGKTTARVHFGCRGFTLNHNTDIWGSTNPVGVIHGQKEGEHDSGRYSFFPLAGAWMCQELWRYYEYTGDADFLKEKAYPLLREAVLFLVDFLVEHDGYYVTCPSASPENAFYTPNGETASVAYASTMDMTIIREAFDHFEKVCGVLEKDDPLLHEIQSKKEKLFPFQTGRHGQLLEWCKDFDEPEPGHRHLSHLYGLFPSEQFCGKDDLIKACKASIDRRIANGGGHTGWSCAWLINLYAMLGDRESAYSQLHTLLTRSTCLNLWDSCPPFQIDGNFGGITGIANLLVQDRGGEMKLLPALPKAFFSGHVRGLRIKGGRTVDITWQDGRITEQKTT